MARLRIGTCSWKYPSWAGLVYSAPEPPDFLAEYAEKYDCVEVDQWFWSLFKGGKVVLPRPEVAAGYAASTPEGFRFSVKCPNSLTLTHEYARGGGEPNPRFLESGLFLRFLDALAPLVPKVGLFVFQFEYLNKAKAPEPAAFRDRLGAFLEALPADLPYAVEIRNPRWMDASWFAFLAERRAAPVLLQGYWMDDLAATWSRAASGPLPLTCIRLHGEDRGGIEEKTGGDWSRVVRPKDEELPRLSAVIKDMLGRGATVWLNVNNHYEGSAPLTIAKIRGLLGEAAAPYGRDIEVAGGSHVE